MTEWDLYGWQTDDWGATRYSLATHLPSDLSDKVMRFRQAIGMADLTSEPHVSVVSPLFQPSDRATVISAAAAIARQTAPFQIEFGSTPPRIGETAGMLHVSPTGPLLTLRQTLSTDLAPLIQFGGNPDKPYTPHVTLYQNASPGTAQRAEQAMKTAQFGQGFRATSVELVARVGPPRGGTRDILQSFQFGP